MFLTIQTLFDDANIVSAIIRRVNQTRKDTIYWQQYLTFRRVTTRVFKDYIGSVTGVMAGSINSRFGEKPIRERRNIGSGYGEIAYLGDAYQMSIDRLSGLQDLIDKFNAAKPADQKGCNGRDCKLPGRRLPSDYPCCPQAYGYYCRCAVDAW